MCLPSVRLLDGPVVISQSETCSTLHTSIALVLFNFMAVRDWKWLETERQASLPQDQSQNIPRLSDGVTWQQRDDNGRIQDVLTSFVVQLEEMGKWRHRSQFAFL